MTDMPPPEDAFQAYAVNGKGGFSAIEGSETGGGAGAAFVWVHLWREAPETLQWLSDNGIDSNVAAALTAEETRPRCTPFGQGAVVTLRGVNLNPGEDPEDMVSIRLWIEETRVVSVWIRPLKAVADIQDALSRGKGPLDPGDLVGKLALRLADRAEPTVAALNERLDTLEEEATSDWGAAHGDLNAIRRAATILRRFMFPQRDALSTLEIEDLPWFTKSRRARLREAVDRVTRLAEELDAIRDRAQVVHDAFMAERADRMNRQMLILSVAAAIFLPLGLVSGLLGMNVGGVPGQDSPYGFLATCALLVAIAAAQLWYFRKTGLFR